MILSAINMGNTNMGVVNEYTEKLFSYGTLRYEPVQLSTFGRTLTGLPDVLRGYKLSQLQIKDPNVIATSGEAIHPILMATNNFTDKVEGVVFDVTSKELELADRYEVADYQREKVTLASGAHAWVYVGRQQKSRG